MTVAQVLAPVAYWNEPHQLYCCANCAESVAGKWKQIKKRVFRWQFVSQADAELLAKDCGKTHCDACGAQIARKTEEQ